MTIHRIFILFLLFQLCPNLLQGSDLEVTLRVHHTRTQFADPIYVEVTITNMGKDVVVAPDAGLTLNNFAFHLFDPDSNTYRIDFRGGGVGGVRDVRYEPGKPVRQYGIIVLPSFSLANQSFWMPYREGKRILISGHYSLTERLSLRSNYVDVFINPRHADELRHLEKWAAEKLEYSKGPSPLDFGIAFQGRMNRQNTLKVISTMRDSELADLLQLTIRLQELYEASPESREKNNQLLVEWLKEQPDIKRQTLIQEVSKLAKRYKLDSTKTAVDALAEDVE